MKRSKHPERVGDAKASFGLLDRLPKSDFEEELVFEKSREMSTHGS